MKQTLTIRGIKFPIIFNASGARGFFGCGTEYWYQRLFFFFGLVWWWTTFVAKTTTRLERRGHMPLKKDGYRPKKYFPECIYLRQAYRGRILNAVGLSGPGFDVLLDTGKWQKRTKPFFLSFMAMGGTIHERLQDAELFFEELAYAQSEFKVPIGLQVNVSCPNTGQHMGSIQKEIEEILEIIQRIPLLNTVPILFKIHPFLTPALAAKLNSHPRLDGWVMSNTIHWNDLAKLGIDATKIFKQPKSPLWKFGGGGYSGPEVRAIVKKWIQNARALGVTKIIIAENGIRTPWHATEMISAGCDGIGIGSMAICRPFFVLPTILATHYAVWKKNNT